MYKGVNIDNTKDEFLRRMFLYRMQNVAGICVTFFIWLGGLFYFVEYSTAEYGEPYLFGTPIFITSIFNTVTYFYSKKMAERYGVEMFADLDQDWLREHQAFDSKAFGEIFACLLQCRKVAGPYMLAVIVSLAFINMYLALGVGVVYFITYFFYRETYLDTAISYKIPWAFGNSIVVSKVLGDEESKSEKQ